MKKKMPKALALYWKTHRRGKGGKIRRVNPIAKFRLGIEKAGKRYFYLANGRGFSDRGSHKFFSSLGEVKALGSKLHAQFPHLHSYRVIATRET